MSGFGFFFFWFCFLYGLAIGELTLRVTGRKRGVSMEILVGSAVGIGLIVGVILNAVLGSGGDPSETLLDALRKPWSYVAIGIAIFAAVGRVRHL